VDFINFVDISGGALRRHQHGRAASTSDGSRHLGIRLEPADVVNYRCPGTDGCICDFSPLSVGRNGGVEFASQGSDYGDQLMYLLLGRDWLRLWPCAHRPHVDDVGAILERLRGPPNGFPLTSNEGALIKGVRAQVEGINYRHGPTLTNLHLAQHGFRHAFTLG